MEYDCSFTQDKHWFRYRTGAIIINDDKTLLMYSETGNHYYSIGGGVHIGEKAEDCIRREVFEETGVDFEVVRPLCLVENFFEGKYGSIDSKICHIIEFYFLMKAPKIMNFKNNSVNIDDESERLVWLPIDKLHVFDVRPRNIISLIKNTPFEFSHFINDEFP